MNLLEVFIILGSIVGSLLFAGGMLWAVFASISTGFTVIGIGSVVIIVTMLIALIYYMWEVYRNGKA